MGDMTQEERKSWKEIRRKRQMKQQRIQQGLETQRELEAKRRPRKLPKGKLVFSACLIALTLAAFGIWQYYEMQKMPTFDNSVIGPATDFSLMDINGTQYSLSQFNGSVIGIHFMGVGCAGKIGAINEHQISQLKIVRDSLSGKGSTVFLTVAASSCGTNDLGALRSTYGVNWILGNDYDDKTLDIVKAYEPHQVEDGSIVLIDKAFNVVKVYKAEISAGELTSEINHLLEV